jgi:hypothetical protein
MEQAGDDHPVRQHTAVNHRPNAFSRLHRMHNLRPIHIRITVIL